MFLKMVQNLKNAVWGFAGQTFTISLNLHNYRTGSFSVSAHAHQTLNTNRAIISEQEFLFATKKELLTNLKEQNMLDLCYITIRQNGRGLITKLIGLTFNSPPLLTGFKAGYLICPVWLYFPNPLIKMPAL